MTGALEIVVVGAGIGGLAASLALAREGHAVSVVERARALGEVGAGLQLSPNAMRAVDALGIGAMVREFASRTEAVELRLAGLGARVHRLELGAAAEARWGAPYLHVHRADLHGGLRRGAEAAGVAIRLDETADGVDAEGPRATLRTSRGGLEADLAIAADGVRSALRETVAGESAPTWSGARAWRALVPARGLPEALAVPQATLWMGPRGHVVTYPLRNRTLVNLVAVEERAGPAEEGWSHPGDPAALRAAFRGWDPAVDALLAAAEAPKIWGLYDHRPLPCWRRGRVALLGDAAHPTTPFLAQGAAMALEDAVVLARALRNRTPEAGLQAYEAARAPRTRRLVRAAGRAGRNYHSRSLPERLVKGGALAALGALAPERAAALNDWIYRYDPVAAPI
ncbi:MAG: FAD-dependent monooxygenase [Paracoccaceae bacterium]